MARDGYKNIFSDEDVRKVSFLSLLFFQWMNSVLKTGNKQALGETDFLPLSKEDTTRLVSDQLQTNWKKETARCKENEKRPKLWKSVVKMLSAKEAMIIIFSGALFSLSRLIQPLFLGYLVSTLMSAETQRSYLSYGCAFAMCVSTLIGHLGLHQLCYRCEMLAIRISSALKALIYFKTLQLGKQKILTFTIGRVIDLLSNDVQRLEGPAIPFLFLSVFPCLELVVIPVLLVYFVGWQALLGVLVLCLLVPYFAVLSCVSAALRRRTAAVSDQRISLMNQVVSGIRAIKTHAWEDIYQQKIKHTRRHEINIIHKKSVILSVVAALEPTSVPLATLVSVITLVLAGQPLTPVIVFILLCYLGVLRSNVCAYLANGLLENYEAFTSLGRIEDFLLLENLPTISGDQSAENTSNKLKTFSTKVIRRGKDQLTKIDEVSFSNGVDRPTVLSVLNLTYKPNIKRENEFILDKISFTLASQSLTVITGPVGSGKSTLLSAIAGEVSGISGTITPEGHVVYVPQEAWVFTGTIRENILFGHPYDEQKYTRIIKACALAEDIQQFPDRDQTVVGERGEVLTGGQQARVSLARAVYAGADLYLLDDPLSAVDFKVAQHIFDKCLKDLLGDKTRVLTSHQEQHMKEADEVIVLYKGRVLVKGSYTELHEKGVLNTTIDPLYKEALKGKQSSKASVFEEEEEEEEEKSEDADSCEKTVPLPSDAKGLEISQEDRKIGVVSSKLYWSYFRSGIPSLVIIGGICFYFITQALIAAPDVWLSFLSKQYPQDQKERKNLTIYGCLVASCAIFAIIRAYTFLLVSLRCSEHLHDKTVVAILQAPVLFFDSNPLGRILNRFSKDVGCLDELLPKNFLGAIQYGLTVLASIILPTVVNPWLLVIDVPLIVIVVYFCKYYLKTSRAEN